MAGIGKIVDGINSVKSAMCHPSWYMETWDLASNHATHTGRRMSSCGCGISRTRVMDPCGRAIARGHEIHDRDGRCSMHELESTETTPVLKNDAESGDIQ